MARRIISVDPSFGRRLRELRTRRRLSLRDLAEAGISKSYLSELETGRKRATPEIAAALDRILHAGGALAALVRVLDGGDSAPVDAADSDEHDALELVRRVSASDIGDETLRRLEWAVDDLATSYSLTPPEELL